MPVEPLLEQASQGNLDVFVRLPDQCGVFSVHEDAVDLNDPRLLASRAFRQVGAPEIESRPADMTNFSVEALQLSRMDCREILSKRIFRQRLFKTGLRTNQLGWLESVRPIETNHFHNKKTLSSEGWHLACYPKTVPIVFHELKGYSQPLGIDLSIDALLATTESAERFINTIDTQQSVIDLFSDGHVVTDRPDYFSEKLQYLIDASEKFWRATDPVERAKGRRREEATTTDEQMEKDAEQQAGKAKEQRKIEVEEERQRGIEDFGIRREKTRAFFSKQDFHNLCDKNEASAGLIDAAFRFSIPVFAREDASDAEREAWPGYITPEIVALMASAKFFWGAKHVDLKVVRTHPRREDIERHLRYEGFKDNDVRFGATLIRPEAAEKGRPIPTAREKRMGLRRSWKSK